MEITANAVQTVAAGQNVVFTDVAVEGNCSIVHRAGSGLIKVRGLTRGCCNRARFRAFFGGNIAVPEGQTTDPISLAITIDGEAVGPATMTVSPTSENSYFNVGADLFIDVPGGTCSTFGVTNISTIPVNVRNANLIVERVA